MTQQRIIIPVDHGNRNLKTENYVFTSGVMGNMGYDALILDFGFPHDTYMDEFYRCTKKLLISSAACWKRHELSTFFEAYPQIKKLESLSFMIPFGTISDMLKIGKINGLPFHQLHSIPFLLNPFHIGKEYFSFFDELI